MDNQNKVQTEETKVEVPVVEEAPVVVEPVVKESKVKKVKEVVEETPVWKNESEDGRVVETKPAQTVCQNCEGGLVVKSTGGFERCPVCLGKGLL